MKLWKLRSGPANVPRASTAASTIATTRPNRQPTSEYAHAVSSLQTELVCWPVASRHDGGYDEPVKIDLPFEEAMRLLLAVPRDDDEADRATPPNRSCDP